MHVRVKFGQMHLIEFVRVRPWNFFKVGDKRLAFALALMLIPLVFNICKEKRRWSRDIYL